MKKLILIPVFAIVFITIVVCGGSAKQEAAQNTETKEENKPVDESVTGTIKQMTWMIYQGMSDGSIILNNGNTYTISSDYGGDNGAGRIFINPEVKDILFLDKKAAKDRLNTSYLDKKVKVTYGQTNRTISKIEMLGGEAIISGEPKILTGFITGFRRNNNGGNFIEFKNENGEVQTLRLYTSEGYDSDSYKVFRGDGGSPKKDCVFEVKSYVLNLVPGNIERKVKIMTELKLVTEVEVNSVEHMEKTILSNENVVTKIDWDGTAMELPKEQLESHD